MAGRRSMNAEIDQGVDQSRGAAADGNGARDRTILAHLAPLQTMSMLELKARWRELSGTEPPPYNRGFLISRLAYRIQELVFGGLKPETVARLDALADQIDREVKPGGRGRRPAANGRPITGTRLIREWKGVEHCATVTDVGFEYQGRPFKSLSAIARAITGTRWNGPQFFGLRNHAGASRCGGGPP